MTIQVLLHRYERWAFSSFDVGISLLCFLCIFFFTQHWKMIKDGLLSLTEHHFSCFFKSLDALLPVGFLVCGIALCAIVSQAVFIPSFEGRKREPILVKKKKKKMVEQVVTTHLASRPWEPSQQLISQQGLMPSKCLHQCRQFLVWSSVSCYAMIAWNRAMVLMRFGPIKEFFWTFFLSPLPQRKQHILFFVVFWL